MNHKTSQRVKRFGMSICLVLALVMCFSLFIFGAGEDPQPTETVKKADETQVKKEEPKKQEEKKCTGDRLIIYDFLDDKPDFFFNSRLDVKYRHNVLFTVKNVNPFLFKVTIKGKAFNYFEEEIPTEFTPEKTEKEPTEVASTVKNIITGEAEKLQTPDYKALNKNDKNKIIADISPIIKGLKQSPDVNIPLLENYLANVENEEFKNQFNRIIATNSIEKFVNSYKKVVPVFELHNSLVQLLIRNETFKELQEKLEGKVGDEKGGILNKLWPKQGFKLDSVTYSFSSWLDEASDAYNLIKFESMSDDSLLEKGLNVTIDELKNYKRNIDKMRKERVIDSICNMLQMFQEKNFERSLMFPTVDADELQFEVKIEPIDEKKASLHQEICGPVRVRVRGGWAINFSTGMIFNFDPIAHHYLLQTQTTEQGKAEIVDDRKWSFYPSLAGLMHIYPRFVGSFGWGGITFGISAKDTEQITYLLGTSLLLGNSDKRFIISGGLALFKTDVLKPGYEPGQILLQDASLKAENLVTKEFKVKFFVGFTYNLTKPKTK